MKSEHVVLVIVLLIVATISFIGWWRERRNSRALARCVKGSTFETQGLIEAGRFLLTAMDKSIEEGYQADVRPFTDLGSAFESELNAQWSYLYHESNGTETQAMSDRWEGAKARCLTLQDQMREEIVRRLGRPAQPGT